MRQDEVMLFIKGTPDVPRCGFSRKIVNLLKDQGVKFSSFDILSDESVRQGIADLQSSHIFTSNPLRQPGLKVYNDWPTFPQLIVKGEFVGGLDVVQEMVENGELKELLT
jgi:glutaredoxin-related protein